MTAPPTRRNVLGALAVGTLLPAFVGTTVVQAAGLSFAPPAGPMVFRRKLRRQLGGNYSLTVERGFEIGFERVRAGFFVTGRQIDVAVNAPENLEAYARLERERREEGIFPLLLDDRGLIRSGPETVSSASLDQAIERALNQVAAELKSQPEIAEARSFILGLQQAAGRISSAMPADLFAPPGTIQRAQRTIELPGGLSGTLSTEFSGAVSPETGLLETAQRIVVTDAGGTRRETVESWSLKPRG